MKLPVKQVLRIYLNIWCFPIAEKELIFDELMQSAGGDSNTFTTRINITTSHHHSMN